MNYLPDGASDDVDADLRRIDDAVRASTPGAVDYYAAPWRRLWLDEQAGPNVVVAEPDIPAVVAPVEVRRRKLHPIARGTYRVSSGFRTPDRPTHRGIDFAADIGVPIYAPADGFFAHVGINDDPGGFGSWLALDAQQEWGLDFVFGHMRPSSMVNPDTGAPWRKGDQVRAGQQIAIVGNEGSSTGPHLHFETWGTPGRFGGQDRNPNTAWLNEAEDPRTPVSSDPDAWPLPRGVYWGPREGPAESWSNLAGSEPQYSKEGLRRWQVALGLPGSGVYDEATRAAAIRMQPHFGWAVSGNVAEGEWNEVIGKGWRLPTQDARPAAVPTSAGGYPVAWYSGPGYTPGHAAYLRIYLHTTENQDWITRAEDVADHQARTKNGPKAGSYHFLVDDKHIINTVATKNTAWGLHKDNRFSVQIAMVGTSGEIEQWPGDNPNTENRPKRREQWLAHPKMLDMVAYVIAIVARDFRIPIERVDVEGVGANRRGVSSHNNYTSGSAKLHGSKDGDHWDVPNTFPYDVVLAAAKGFEAIVSDPDRFPLPPGHYWGPLDGPSESWSNTFGNEPPSSNPCPQQ